MASANICLARCRQAGKAEVAGISIRPLIASTVGDWTCPRGQDRERSREQQPRNRV